MMCINEVPFSTSTVKVSAGKTRTRSCITSLRVSIKLYFIWTRFDIDWGMYLTNKHASMNDVTTRHRWMTSQHCNYCCRVSIRVIPGSRVNKRKIVVWIETLGIPSTSCEAEKMLPTPALKSIPAHKLAQLSRIDVVTCRFRSINIR